MGYIDKFVEDCKHYDPKNKEIKNILKYVDLKNKVVLDIGSGIGRLSIPLSRYAKEVIALDKDKRLKEHFKKNKKENLIFVNKSLEDYSKNLKESDVIIIAWPTFNLKFIKLIKKLKKKDAKIIFISCYNASDFETIPDKLGITTSQISILKKRRFIRELVNNFKIIKRKQIKTEYVYPNEKTAFRIINNSFKIWYNLKLKNTHKERLIKLIKKHKKLNRKIKFKEKLYFYVLK